MKTIVTYLFLLCGAIYSADAQNWVDTTAQNKKVVLEEFTGIHCVYCPDGHKRANNLANSNEGDVFLINIHTGGYAVPGTGELDLRTSVGDAIASQAGITGYPAGSVNRAKSPWAESRGTWATTAGNIMSQPSPVNTYVKSYFDRNTRELTTEVEVFFTGNVSGNYKLTVALTQDFILGTQTGGTTYYPENFFNGEYKHNHVLRQMLTPGGAWGDTINSPSKGDYIYRKYVTTLPESIKGVPLTFYNLNVVAFVSEGNNTNIMTAHGSKVAFDLNGTIDLSITNNTPPTSGICVDPFTPGLVVKNNSQDTISSFEITMTLNNKDTTRNYSGTLLPDDTVVITFNDAFQPRGEYSLSISGYGAINNGDLIDINPFNDILDLGGIGFEENAFTYGKFSLNGTMDEHTARMVNQNESYVLVTKGGFDGGGAIRYSLHSSWGVQGKPGDIVIGGADFTSITDPQLSFYYAYSDGGQGGTAPTITVKASENCGSSWTQVNSIQCESTGEPSNPANYYVPVTSEYIQHVVDLSAVAGKSVMLMISGIPGTNGNAMYIDEVEVGSAAKIASVLVTEIEGLNVYPNPASNVLNISLQNGNNGVAELYDMQGNLVASVAIVNGSAVLETGSLAMGMYLVKVTSDEASATTKVVISN